MSAKNEYPREYLEGLRLYREEKYWESHEAWEEVWRRAQGEERHFLQALIQLDAALLHTKKAHWKGVRNLINRSLGHLGHCSAQVLGLRTFDLIEQLRAYLREIEKLMDGEKEEFDWSFIPSLDIKGFQ